MVVNNISQTLPDECLTNDTLKVYLIPDDQLNQWFYTQLDIILITVLLPVISAVGLILNSALLIVIVKVREMQTITNFYLGNLAISDFMFILIKLISYLCQYYESKGLLFVDNIGSTLMCVLENASIHIFFFASFAFVVLVSSERFYAVCSPIKYRILLSHSKKRALKYVISTWTMSVLLAFFMSPFWSRVTKFCVIWDVNGTYDILSYCGSHESAAGLTYTHAVIEQIYFFLAFGASTVFYVAILKTLTKRQTSTALCNNMTHQIRAKSVRNQVARMVIINGLVFFLCLIPSEIYNIYIYSGGVFFTDDQANTLEWIARLMEAVNSSVNPIVYTVASSRYRKAFVETFCCKEKTINRTTSLETLAIKPDTRL